MGELFGVIASPGLKIIYSCRASRDKFPVGPGPAPRERI